jgi:hypothetical protein
MIPWPFLSVGDVLLKSLVEINGAVSRFSETEYRL